MELALALFGLGGLLIVCVVWLARGEAGARARRKAGDAEVKRLRAATERLARPAPTGAGLIRRLRNRRDR